MTLVLDTVQPHDEAVRDDAAEFAAWLEEEDLADAAPADRVELDIWFDRRLAALAAIEAEMRRNEEVAQRRIEMIRAWMEEQNAALQRRADFLRSLLEQAARAYPYPGKAKSRKLPHGTFGSRTVPPKLEIEDEMAALAFAKAQVPDAVRVRESVLVSELKTWWQSTGILPDGCREVPAEERFYVTAGGE
ncbi:MAG TPA: host-nuclease inhibitor Gam family protein [Longimicrobiales bacterium]